MNLIHELHVSSNAMDVNEFTSVIVEDEDVFVDVVNIESIINEGIDNEFDEDSDNKHFIHNDIEDNNEIDNDAQHEGDTTSNEVVSSCSRLSLIDVVSAGKKTMKEKRSRQHRLNLKVMNYCHDDFLINEHAQLINKEKNQKTCSLLVD